ncbi:MAG: N-6 DNA methylase [Deltaproteobacteria bacterium]|nr:N-6 DNA methylase [Deltaproteobacteria bacterium]
MTRQNTISEARRAPTVRQREVLGRLGETFTAAELSMSACHRYEGHTRRMLRSMVDRGAIEASGEGRYRKTALAVPPCVGEPIEVVPSRRRRKDEAGDGSSGAGRGSRKTRRGEPAADGARRRRSTASDGAAHDAMAADARGQGRRATERTGEASGGKGEQVSAAVTADGSRGKGSQSTGSRGEGRPELPRSPLQQPAPGEDVRPVEPPPSGSTATQAESVVNAPAYTISAGRHARHGHAIWTVQLRDFAPRDRFKELKRLARAAATPGSAVASGYYSSFKGNGAIPGYIFGSEAEARRFVDFALPGATPAARPEALSRAVNPTPARHADASGRITAPSWPPAPEKASVRTRANLKAVRLANALRVNGAQPGAEERTTLLQYSGWGGLSIEKVQHDWPEGVQLPASQSLVHEYYTPWQICSDITATVERLLPGVDPIRALEPSAGVGRFVHTTAPERWRWTAIELSPLSALILSQSVPAGTIVATSSFEAWVNANSAQRFDAIVSNPPYGPRGESITADKDKRFRTRAAYDYFLLRAMSLLSPGGIAAFLIPGGFLTGGSKRQLRARVAADAALLGAFRLPSGIFPGARLTLDVVFLARRDAADEPDDIFLSGGYFDAFPAHVLGEVKASGRWGEAEVIGDYTGLPTFTPRFTIAPPARRSVRVTRRPAEAPTPAPQATPARPASGYVPSPSPLQEITPAPDAPLRAPWPPHTPPPTQTHEVEIPDLVGLFAWRKGTLRVIPIDNRALDFESNIDGIMQRLASEGPGAWILHSRASAQRPFDRVRTHAMTVAKRHGVDLEAVHTDVVRQSPTRLPAFEVPPLPEPRLPALGDRARRPVGEAHRRAARFLPRAGGRATGLGSVWHSQGRAVVFDGTRLVEVPSLDTAATRWQARGGAAAEAWPAHGMMSAVEVLHHAAEPGGDVIAQADAESLRAAVEPLGEEALLRVRGGELYVEPVALDPATPGRHVGPARGRDVLARLPRRSLWDALSDARGDVSLRLSGLARSGEVEYISGRVIVDRADGERHVIATRGFEYAEILPLASRPLLTLRATAVPTNLAPGFTGLEMEGDATPAVPAPMPTLELDDEESPMPSGLAPGFTALEMEDDPTPARKPPKASASKRGSGALPAGLQAIEMEQTTRAVAAAIERARSFTDATDDVLAGVRVGEGKVIASDGSRAIEIAVDDTGPVRVLDAAGRPMRVDYPALADLLPVADPLATLPDVRLDAIATRLDYGPVRLDLVRRKLSVASSGACNAIAGAIAERGSSDGAWTFDGRHLRDALAGATTGTIRFGAGRTATVIERADGERHLILPLDDDCDDCPVCITEAGERAIAPPEGPDETTLAALLASRVSAYERADARTRALLHPELAGALDAFHTVFGRRLARLAPPLRVADEIAANATEARRLLRAFPAGVPLSRVRDARALIDQGWRLDGDRLLPRDDYLSGNLWSRLDRLAAIPETFADVEPRQRAELNAAIGEVSFAEVSDRVSLRDGWVPLPVIAAFLVSVGRSREAHIALVRRDGVVQLQVEGTSYDGITKAYDGRSPIRLVIGYINHDEKVFSPSKKKDEDINIVRREKADDFEGQFKAFLGAQPEHRDAVVEAYRRAHKGFLPRTYSGHPLELARWGNAVTPHPHQNAGARRAVDQRGMVAAYGVGVGKTFTACATVALARQQLGTRRPVILVPNSLVSKWQRDIAAALPDYAVVTIGEQATVGRDGKLRYGPDSKRDRETKWRRFREGLYDIALITVTAFLRTRIGADEFEALVASSPEVQRAVRLSQRNAAARTAGRRTERQQAVLEQGVRAWLAQMTEATHELDDVRWAELGVDLLIVDEAQNYKGLHQPENREGGIPRFMGQSAPSKRAWGLDARARQVRARSGFVVLLSATPAKNSPLELYNLWSYVNGELWRDHGIHDPEAFISRFLDLKPRLVIDTTMEASMRLAVTGFKHLDELKSILLRWGEFIQPADIGLTVPEPTTELVEVDLDASQEEKYAGYVKAVEDEIDDMRKGMSSGSRLLSLLGKMSLVAVHNMLDEGLDYDSAAGVEHRSPKFDAIGDAIMRQRGCGHIVFVQPIAAHRWLKETLINRGIPASRIGVLNAVLAQSSAARQRIADHFNAGRLDVVIANSVAYEGLDLQQRTCAVHHADLPWEPATLNQRNGRAVRQGNELNTVAIRYYFARRSMDGLRFNI